MKKIIALLLVAVMAVSMAACGGTADEGSKDTTGNQIEASVSALEVLENIWAKYGENDKFFAMGGFKLDAEGVPVTVENAPGVVEDNDYLNYSLLVPAEQTVTEAASLMHAMNANTFTCGAYKVADVQAFATAMQTAIQGNQWMCGFPETLLIANVSGVVVVAFGNGQVMSTFQGYLTSAYANAEILINEAIG